MARKVEPTSPAVLREIPQRTLRNDIAKVLAEVAAGARFRITVNGHPVADLVPAPQQRTWVPRAEVERILRETPVDDRFLSDVRGALDQRVDEL